MNYEELYAQYLVKDKELRELINSQQKYYKRISKEMNDGDVKNAVKDINWLKEALQTANHISSDNYK